MNPRITGRLEIQVCADGVAENNSCAWEVCSMDDEQLYIRLRRIGKACFAKHFCLFKESFASSRKTGETAELLKSREPGYAKASCKLRASYAKSIFEAGRERDALINISCPRKSPRVPPDVADQARKLASKL